MNLEKWKCGTCDFEWFEPVKFYDCGKNINHGCPQGCDDAGTVVGIAEATERKDAWKEKSNSKSFKSFPDPHRAQIFSDF